MSLIRLRELRKQRNIMAKSVAEAVKIGYRTYQKYETGEIDLPISNAIAIADFFDVSIDYLVGRSDDPEKF